MGESDYHLDRLILKREWLFEHSEWFKPYYEGYLLYKEKIPAEPKKIRGSELGEREGGKAGGGPFPWDSGPPGGLTEKNSFSRQASENSGQAGKTERRYDGLS